MKNKKERVSKIYNTDYGYVFSFKDYVNSIPNGESILYLRSDKKSEELNRRITVFSLHDDKVIITSSIGYDNKSDIVKKLYNIGLTKTKSVLEYDFDIPKNFRGATWIPLNRLLDFNLGDEIDNYNIDDVYRSPEYYYINTLGGPIPRDVLFIVKTQLEKQIRLRIKSQKKQMFNARTNEKIQRTSSSS